MNSAKKLPDSFLPAEMQILSGSVLKLIAILVMLIDHIGAHLLYSWAPAREPLFSMFGNTYSLYRISRDIGRIAFPIFCFLLVEGFLHTHSRWKYGRNLLLFACISEIPWNFVHTGTLYYQKQNVFFTLFLGYLGFCVIEYFWEQPYLRLLFLCLLLLVSMYLGADYGWRGYVFLLIMYGFRNERVSQAIIGGCWLYFEWKAVFAYLPINMYNGQRGFIKDRFGKYFFYAFYPIHLLILGLIKYHYI